jgi:hypothetical protein
MNHLHLPVVAIPYTFHAIAVNDVAVANVAFIVSMDGVLVAFVVLVDVVNPHESSSLHSPTLPP